MSTLFMLRTVDGRLIIAPIAPASYVTANRSKKSVTKRRKAAKTNELVTKISAN